MKLAMKTKVITLFFLLGVAVSSYSQSKSKSLFNKPHYQEVDFEDLMHRYFGKEAGSHSRLEGIYSVSCVITKTNKGFLTGRQKIKIVERKDNYARVAILKDWPDTDRDFIEVSLSLRVTNRYPIVGEMSTIAAGDAYIYKHIEPDGSMYDYSMAAGSTDLIEGEHSEMDRRKTITYKLSYMKIYPKMKQDDIVKRN